MEEKTVCFDDDDHDSYSSTTSSSSLDSRGQLRSNSTIARAASFMQMEKARGRVPSVAKLDLPVAAAAAAFEEPSTPKRHDQPPKPVSDEPQREANDASSSSSLGGLLVSEAQMKLFGVSTAKELREEFAKVLDEGAPTERPKSFERTGPGVGRACVEAIVSLSQKKKKKIEMSRIDALATAAKPVAKKERNSSRSPFHRAKAEKRLEVMRQCGYDFIDQATAEDSRESDFVDRVTRMEKQRRAKLEHARGVADYELRIDKKICPGCGAKQTYDEMINKRKKCQECGVDYRVPRPRGSRGNISSWLVEQADRDLKRKLARQKAEEAYEQQRRGGKKIHQSPASSKTQRAEFLDRLTADLKKREARRKIIPEEQQQPQQKELPPPPPYERQRRRRQQPVAMNKKKLAPPASSAKKEARAFSKWEDDLEEYVRRVSSSRHSEAADNDASRKVVAARLVKSATLEKKKKNKAHAAEQGCLDTFDQLLYA